MTPPDPARIAAGLTEAEQAAILRFPVRGTIAETDLTGAQVSGLNAIQYRGLRLIALGWNEPRLCLTPLGRAVRAALADGRAATPDDGART